MKTLCPYHDDTNPSLEIYPDGVYCFVCGTRASLAEYEAKTGVRSLAGARDRRPREDVAASIKHILTLPKMQIRGLDLHCDQDSYYIVWPNADYYLRRQFEPGEGPKYIGPAGHSRPLLRVAEGLIRRTDGKGLTLLICEGELNALSLGKALQNEMGIVSPGAASQFNDPAHFGTYLRYERVVLLVDEDRAGAMACVKLLPELGKRGARDVQCVLMRKQKDGGLGDANEIFTKEGASALREYVLGKISF